MPCCSCCSPPILFVLLPDRIGGIQEGTAKEDIQQRKRDVHGDEAENHTADKNDAEDQTEIKVTDMNNLLPFCLFAGFLFTMQAYTKRSPPAGMSANGRFLTAKKRRAPERLPAASQMEVISF